MSQYIPLLILLAVVVILVTAIVGISALLGVKRPNEVKGLPYECGIDPAPSQRRPFSIKFYMVAIVFLLFDVEVALLYPWAAVYKNMSSIGLLKFAVIEALIFVGVLAFGLLYVWKRGALEWEK